MSVHQLKDGRWIVKYAKGVNRGDPERTREYFGRGEAAQEAAARRNIELGMGQGSESGGVLFEELAEGYMVALSASMTKSTKEQTIIKLAANILPALGRLPWQRITPDRLARYVVDRSATVKTSTIHRELTIVRAIIRWAVRRKKIPLNPMVDYQFPRRDITIITPPTEAELAAIHQHALPHLQRAIMLGYYTGMRPGPSELLALRWEQGDLINGTIFVQSAKKGGMRARVVPIADGLDTLLRQWLAEDRERGHLGAVIHYRGKPVAQLMHSWKRAKALAGISRRLRLYDLRHMAATTMLDAGADLQSVYAILGHASPDMTLMVYQHTSTAGRRSAVAHLKDPLVTSYQGVSKKD